MSKIIYVLSNISLPDHFVNEVEKMMFTFLWNGPHKIKRTTMFADYSDGGLNFPNIQCMVKTQLVKWIQRYFCKSAHNWTLLFEHFLRPYGGKTLFVSNYAIEKLPQIGDIPPFYVNLLKAWLKTSIHSQIADEDGSQASILAQCVWNNQAILVEDMSFYCKPLYEAGLSYVYQLFDINGEILSFDLWKRKGVSNKYCLKYRAIVHSVKKDGKLILIICSLKYFGIRKMKNSHNYSIWYLKWVNSSQGLCIRVSLRN